MSVVGDLDLKVFRAGAADGVPDIDEGLARLGGVGVAAGFADAVLSVAIEELARVGGFVLGYGAVLDEDGLALGAWSQPVYLTFEKCIFSF